MKGIIFNLLEQVVVAEHGEDVWDAILEKAGSGGTYTAVGSYDDAELLGLVAAASELTGTPADDLVRWFGKRSIPLLADRYPIFFTPHQKTVPFLLTLNEVIHPEVRKLFPGAYAPSFTFDQQVEGGVGLTYQSHRQLCSFAEGLIEGAAEHYGEKATITQTACTKRGDVQCMIVSTFAAA